MNNIGLILLIILCAQAAALGPSQGHQLLAMPMEKRVAEFKNQPGGAQWLAQTAFDSQQTLRFRWRAITTMGRWDAQKFREPLERALQSREWFMRNAALIAIQYDTRERAVLWSTRLLEDRALVVRTQAVRNLIDLNAQETEPLLWRSLWSSKNFKGHESLWVRAHLAEAVAKMAKPERASDFKKLLLDQDERLHKWAIVGLEQSTGIQMSARREPVEIKRRKWLARLGLGEI